LTFGDPQCTELSGASTNDGTIDTGFHLLLKYLLDRNRVDAVALKRRDESSQDA
jgi:hypothetical protein